MNEKKTPRPVDFCTVVPLNLGNHQKKKVLIWPCVKDEVCQAANKQLLAEDR